MEENISEINSDSKEPENISEKLKETIDKIKSIEKYNDSYYYYLFAEKSDEIRDAISEFSEYCKEKGKTDDILQVFFNIIDGIGPNDIRKVRHVLTCLISTIPNKKIVENWVELLPLIISKLSKIMPENEVVLSYARALKYIFSREDSSKIVEFLCKIIDLKTELGIKIIKESVMSESLSDFEDLILKKILEDTSPKNIKLCMKAVAEATNGLLGGSYFYIEVILRGVMKEISPDNFKAIASPIISVMSNDFMPREKLLAISLDVLKHRCSIKDYFKLRKLLHESLGPELKKYEDAEKSATVASGTSSGNPSYEKYEELSRPLDSGVAGLSSSSGTGVKKISGEKNKKLDHSVEDDAEEIVPLKKRKIMSESENQNEEIEELNHSVEGDVPEKDSKEEDELSKALKEMHLKDKSRENEPSKKRKKSSEPEGPDKKRGKWQKFTSNRTSQSGSISNEL